MTGLTNKGNIILKGQTYENIVTKCPCHKICRIKEKFTHWSKYNYWGLAMSLKFWKYSYNETVQWRANVGPPSTILVQHWPSIERMSHVLLGVPSKGETINVCPPSSALVLHWASIGSASRIYLIIVLCRAIYTQSTVQPVPTKHRRHACIKMRTALPANTKTWPNVVSMLVQRRWQWANIETALGQILAFAGLHTGVCLHPPVPHHNILASRSGYL